MQYKSPCLLAPPGRKDTTAEKLVEALVKIGLKKVAESFPCKPSDPSQVILTDMDRVTCIKLFFTTYLTLGARHQA